MRRTAATRVAGSGRARLARRARASRIHVYKRDTFRTPAKSHLFPTQHTRAYRILLKILFR